MNWTGVHLWATTGAALCLAFATAWLLPGGTAGWLAAAVFWSGLPIGGLFLILTMHLVPGRWAKDYADLIKPALVLLAPALFAFVPVGIGVHGLYPWAEAAASDAPHPVYFTTVFFAVRTVLFFGLLAVVSVGFLFLERLSTTISVVGLVVLSLGGMVLYADWLMSLDGDFHSSEFGLYVLSIQVTVALTCLMPVRLSRQLPETRIGMHGGLLLTAILFWIYLAFMQLLIIWSTNLPSTTSWYLERGEGGWGALFALISVLQIVPGFLLLFGPVRNSRRWLTGFCIAVAVAKWLEILWIALPGHGGGAVVSALTGSIGLGLLFVAVLGGRRGRASAPQSSGEVSVGRET
jgi:hypothetical protein